MVANLALDLISNGPVDLLTLKMAMAVHKINVFNTLIYAFYCNSFKSAEEYIEPLVKGRDTYLPGGYVEKELKHYQGKATEEENKWIIYPHQKVAFEEMLALLKESNIPFYLVQSPITSTNYAAYQNNEALDSLYNAYGNYINFNGLIALSDSLHFFDHHHLNKLGVEKFNLALIQHLNLDNRSK